MSWENILKSYTAEMFMEAYIALQEKVIIWAGINNYPMGNEDEPRTLAYRLLMVKQIALEDVEMDTYKQFSKIEDITDDDEDGDNPTKYGYAIQEPLWKLYKMVEWREDNR